MNANNNTSLSVRLRESVHDITARHMNSSYVQEVLMAGQLTVRNKAVVHFAYKEGRDMLASYLYLFRVGLLLATRAHEEQYFESEIKAWDTVFAQHCINVMKMVGPIEARVLRLPITHWTDEYNKHVVNEANSGSMLRLLATLLPGYMGYTEAYDYVVRHPHYKANPVLDMLSVTFMSPHKRVDTINKLINARAPVAADEERAVFKTFRHTWEMDCRHHGSHYDVEKFDIFRP